MIRRFAFGSMVILTLIMGGLAGRAFADQPHMRAALDHLRSARSALQNANADKGGHRVRALGLVGDAIREVERGIEYERTH
jgi:hypothetical protein